MESPPRPIVLSFMAERTAFPAPGLAGGAAGGLGDVRINGKRVDNRRQHVLERGDRVLVSTPGGGGYGPAGRRDRRLTERDRELGYVGQGRGSARAARQTLSALPEIPSCSKAGHDVLET